MALRTRVILVDWMVPRTEESLDMLIQVTALPFLFIKRPRTKTRRGLLSSADDQGSEALDSLDYFEWRFT